jgi:hypothetical protein
LHGDLSIGSNNLQVNFDGNSFHLEQLTFVTTYDDPTLDSLPRYAPFDTLIGEGIGRFNNQSGYRVRFTFTDNSEPGKNDFARIQIEDPAGNIVLFVAGYLHNGNQQAHPENKTPALLQAAAPATAQAIGQVLNSSDLIAIVAEAKQQWANTGLTAAQRDQLAALQLTVADLPGLNLGESSGGHIVIDTDAAGYGWFIDPTPAQNEEYLTMPNGSLQAKAASDALGRMDLFTVISHEIGHVLGYTHTDADNGQAELMDADLVAGVRELPAATAANAERVAGDRASAPATSTGVSYFDADTGAFVKASQTLAPSAKQDPGEFLVVLDPAANKPRHELFELTRADDKRVSSVPPLVQDDEGDSLVGRLKKMAVWKNWKK